MTSAAGGAQCLVCNQVNNLVGSHIFTEQISEGESSLVFPCELSKTTEKQNLDNPIWRGLSSSHPQQSFVPLHHFWCIPLPAISQDRVSSLKASLGRPLMISLPSRCLWMDSRSLEFFFFICFQGTSLFHPFIFFQERKHSQSHIALLLF